MGFTSALFRRPPAEPGPVLATLLTLLALLAAFAFPLPDQEEVPAQVQSFSPVAVSQPALPVPRSTVAAYIAQRWQIGQSAAERLVTLAWHAAEDRAVDPLLVLAVIAKESAFKFTGNAGDLQVNVNPRTVDPLRPHGLMQVSGQAHVEKMPVNGAGQVRPTSDRENLQVGTRILEEYIRLERGDTTRALQRYNGNLADGERRYARRVLKLRSELRRAAGKTA